MTAKSHPAAMRFIPDQLPRESIPNNHVSSSSDLLLREPARYVSSQVINRNFHNTHSSEWMHIMLDV